jgi:hypothetical protein
LAFAAMAGAEVPNVGAAPPSGGTSSGPGVGLASGFAGAAALRREFGVWRSGVRRLAAAASGQASAMASMDEREPGGIADDLSVVDVRPDELDEEDGQESDYAANVEDDD